jgi:hypothetical protein
MTSANPESKKRSDLVKTLQVLLQEIIKFIKPDRFTPDASQDRIVVSE